MVKIQKKPVKAEVMLETLRPRQFNYTLALKRIAVKFIVLFLVLALNWAGFLAIGNTLAYLNDYETAIENTWKAGSVNFSLLSLADFYPAIESVSVTSSREIDVIDDGSLAFEYQAKANNFSGELCDYLDVEVQLDGSPVYSGSLKNFSHYAGQHTSTTDNWELTASLIEVSGDVWKNKACNFDLVFEGVQLGGGGFFDIETIANTIVSANISPPPPTPPLPPTPQPGDVVINEVMWMGSQDIANPSYDGPNDQWIELKNISSNDLRLKDWYLTYQSNAGNELELVTIGNNRIVKSGEYFLLSYYTKNNSAINVQPDEDMDKSFGYGKFQLKLYAASTSPILIDTAGNGSSEPTKGDKTNFYSMERNAVPSDGTNYDNWHTCLDASSTNMYWDSGRTERGTPGAVNLSENDPAYTPDTISTPSSTSGISITEEQAVILDEMFLAGQGISGTGNEESTSTDNNASSSAGGDEGFSAENALSTVPILEEDVEIQEPAIESEAPPAQEPEDILEVLEGQNDETLAPQNPEQTGPANGDIQSGDNAGDDDTTIAPAETI